MGVPRLRAIFLDVFGHHTASNNGAWLRRKLAEPAEGGRGRAAQIRARDASAAIWTTGRVKGVSKVQASPCNIELVTQSCRLPGAWLTYWPGDLTAAS